MWTMPQGYALEQMGFGWEYSFTGTLMPLVYYIGAKTCMHPQFTGMHHAEDFMDSTVAMSELLWGMWVWFVLIQACLSQGVRRVRIRIYNKNRLLGYRPYSTREKIKYESLNRPLLRAFYESLVIILTILYSFTPIYYSLVVQSDRRDKGQTFFGIFASTLVLFFFLSWVWGVRYRNFALKRLRRNTINNAICNGDGCCSNRNGTQPSVSEEGEGGSETLEILQAASVSTLTCMDHYEALSRSILTTPPYSPLPYHSSHRPKDRGKPLLSWPYSHPDRLSPTEEQRQQVLDISEAVYPQNTPYSTLVTVWRKLEHCVWLDMFVVLRRTIGLATLLGAIFSMIMIVTATVVDWKNARLMSELEPP